MSVHKNRSGKEDLVQGVLAALVLVCDAVEHDGRAGGVVGRGAAHTDWAWVCVGQCSHKSGVGSYW